LRWEIFDVLAKILATATAVKSELVNDVSAFSEFIESVDYQLIYRAYLRPVGLPVVDA
jgi:hypothetical protein